MNTSSQKPYVLLVVGLLIFISGMVWFFFIRNAHPTTTAVTTATTTPTKTDFGTKLPDTFPINIPVEKGAVVNQSYSLAYNQEQQLSIVFPSTKTIAANYALYADFLNTDGWTVSNKYQSATVSSLYGTKSSESINITISQPTVASTSVLSQVSISVLLNN